MNYAEESLKMHYDLKGKIEVTARASVDSKEALLSLYLAILDITKKWTGTPHNWMSIANQLMIYFEGRIVNDDLIV